MTTIDMKKRILKQLTYEKPRLYCSHDQDKFREDFYSKGPCESCRKKLTGIVTGLRGDVTGLRGIVTGLRGDVTSLRGNTEEIKNYDHTPY